MVETLCFLASTQFDVVKIDAYIMFIIRRLYFKQLKVVLIISNHRFVTVLEYCDGNDLDFLLKQQKTIPEKEVI